MGTSCASFHALWPGSVADAARAVSRAYTKLGYERVRKAPAEQLDKAVLERVAAVTEQNGSTKIVKRPDCAMEDLELALFADTANRKRATDAARLACQ
jgi:hypothetical protein